jgi:hypothetical protein
MVQKWIVQRNSPILFWRFRGVIDSNSLSTTSDISKDLAKVSVDKPVEPLQNVIICQHFVPGPPREILQGGTILLWGPRTD